MTMLELWDAASKMVSNGVFPPSQELASKVNIGVSVVKKVYSTWENKNLITKDSKGVYTLVKKDEPVVKEENVKDKIQEKKSKFSLLQIVCLVLGILLMICSVHFTYVFNKLSMQPVWAFMLSVAIVGYACFAFTIASLAKGFHKTVVYTMYIVGISYSIFTAVASQYDSFKNISLDDKTSIMGESIDSLKKELKDVETQEKELLPYVGLEKTYNLDPDLKIHNNGTWHEIQDNVQKLSALRDEKSSLQKELKLLSEKQSETNKNVYTWISTTFHISAGLIQFIVILFPSMFIDIVSGIVIKYSFVKKEED